MRCIQRVYFRCAFAKFTAHLLLAGFCFRIWVLRWSSSTRILLQRTVKETQEINMFCLCFGHITQRKTIKNGVEILRLFFSISFVFALLCGSCGCRGLPVSSKSGEGNSTSTDVFPSCSTLSFRVVFVIYCDIVIYSAMLLGRLALIYSLHLFFRSTRKQKLQQPS